MLPLSSFIISLQNLVAQMLKKLPAIQETWIKSLSQEDPMEKEMATHFSILTWRIPVTKEPDRLWFMGLQTAGHVWVNNTVTFQHNHHLCKLMAKVEKFKMISCTVFRIAGSPRDYFLSISFRYCDYATLCNQNFILLRSYIINKTEDLYVEDTFKFIYEFSCICWSMLLWI